jgi:hypothetical protein
MEERPAVWRVVVKDRISSREQPTKGGPPAWGLGEELTTPREKPNVENYS